MHLFADNRKSKKKWTYRTLDGKCLASEGFYDEEQLKCIISAKKLDLAGYIKNN